MNIACQQQHIVIVPEPATTLSIKSIPTMRVSSDCLLLSLFGLASIMDRSSAMPPIRPPLLVVSSVMRGGATVDDTFSSPSDTAPATQKIEKKKTSKKVSSKASAAAQEHVTKEIKSTSPNYRIQRELKAFLADPPSNLQVKVGKNIRVWIIDMTGAKGTIYEGERFRLRVAFPPQYPTVPPSVYFLPPNIPVHERELSE